MYKVYLNKEVLSDAQPHIGALSKWLDKQWTKAMISAYKNATFHIQKQRKCKTRDEILKWLKKEIKCLEQPNPK